MAFAVNARTWKVNQAQNKKSNQAVALFLIDEELTTAACFQQFF